MNYPIIIDNFFDNVDDIRSYALKLNYVQPSTNDGWRGYRCLDQDQNIVNLIKDKISKLNEKFLKFNFTCYFHYSLEKTKDTCYPSFEKFKLHKDPFEYAGVVYLTPNAPENYGTSIYKENPDSFITREATLIKSIDNVYNRFIFYPGDTLHAPTDLFGNSIESSRLILTIFANSNNKE